MSDQLGGLFQFKTMERFGRRPAASTDLRLAAWDKFFYPARFDRRARMPRLAVTPRRPPPLPVEAPPAAPAPDVPPPTLMSVRGRRDGGLPCVRLMLAVLDDALVTIFSEAACRSREWAEATAWVLSDATRWPFSFTNICDALDINVLALRRRVAPWLGREPSPGSPESPAAIADELRRAART